MLPTEQRVTRRQSRQTAPPSSCTRSQSHSLELDSLNDHGVSSLMDARRLIRKRSHSEDPDIKRTDSLNNPSGPPAKSRKYDTSALVPSTTPAMKEAEDSPIARRCKTAALSVDIAPDAMSLPCANTPTCGGEKIVDDPVQSAACPPSFSTMPSVSPMEQGDTSVEPISLGLVERQVKRITTCNILRKSSRTAAMKALKASQLNCSSSKPMSLGPPSSQPPAEQTPFQKAPAKKPTPRKVLLKNLPSHNRTFRPQTSRERGRSQYDSLFRGYVHELKPQRGYYRLPEPQHAGLGYSFANQCQKSIPTAYLPSKTFPSQGTSGGTHYRNPRSDLAVLSQGTSSIASGTCLGANDAAVMLPTHSRTFSSNFKDTRLIYIHKNVDLKGQKYMNIEVNPDNRLLISDLVGKIPNATFTSPVNLPRAKVAISRNQQSILRRPPQVKTTPPVLTVPPSLVLRPPSRREVGEYREIRCKPEPPDQQESEIKCQRVLPYFDALKSFQHAVSDPAMGISITTLTKEASELDTTCNDVSMLTSSPFQGIYDTGICDPLSPLILDEESLLSTLSEFEELSKNVAESKASEYEMELPHGSDEKGNFLDEISTPFLSSINAANPNILTHIEKSDYALFHPIEMNTTQMLGLLDQETLSESQDSSPDEVDEEPSTQNATSDSSQTSQVSAGNSGQSTTVVNEGVEGGSTSCCNEKMDTTEMSSDSGDVIAPSNVVTNCPTNDPVPGTSAKDDSVDDTMNHAEDQVEMSSTVTIPPRNSNTPCVAEEEMDVLCSDEKTNNDNSDSKNDPSCENCCDRIDQGVLVPAMEDEIVPRNVLVCHSSGMEQEVGSSCSISPAIATAVEVTACEEEGTSNHLSNKESQVESCSDLPELEPSDATTNQQHSKEVEEADSNLLTLAYKQESINLRETETAWALLDLNRAPVILNTSDPIQGDSDNKKQAEVNELEMDADLESSCIQSGSESNLPGDLPDDGSQSVSMSCENWTATVSLGPQEMTNEDVTNAVVSQAMKENICESQDKNPSSPVMSPEMNENYIIQYEAASDSVTIPVPETTSDVMPTLHPENPNVTFTTQEHETISNAMPTLVPEIPSESLPSSNPDTPSDTEPNLHSKMANLELETASDTVTSPDSDVAYYVELTGDSEITSDMVPSPDPGSAKDMVRSLEPEVVSDSVSSLEPETASDTVLGLEYERASDSSTDTAEEDGDEAMDDVSMSDYKNVTNATSESDGISAHPEAEQKIYKDEDPTSNESGTNATSESDGISAHPEAKQEIGKDLTSNESGTNATSEPDGISAHPEAEQEIYKDEDPTSNESGTNATSESDGISAHPEAKQEIGKDPTSNESGTNATSEPDGISAHSEAKQEIDKDEDPTSNESGTNATSEPDGISAHPEAKQEIDKDEDPTSNESGTNATSEPDGISAHPEAKQEIDKDEDPTSNENGTNATSEPSAHREVEQQMEVEINVYPTSNENCTNAASESDSVLTPFFNQAEDGLNPESSEEIGNSDASANARTESTTVELPASEGDGFQSDHASSLESTHEENLMMEGNQCPQNLLNYILDEEETCHSTVQDLITEEHGVHLCEAVTSPELPQCDYMDFSDEFNDDDQDMRDYEFGRQMQIIDDDLAQLSAPSPQLIEEDLYITVEAPETLEMLENNIDLEEIISLKIIELWVGDELDKMLAMYLLNFCEFNYSTPGLRQILEENDRLAYLKIHRTFGW